jgi:general secretion pathway protein D
VLISGDELERARMRSLVTHLDTPLEQSGNVKVVYLEYANAVDIAEVLTNVMKNITEMDAAEGGGKAGGRPGVHAGVFAGLGTIG